MNTKVTSHTASETLNVAIERGSTMELVAVIAAMVFVACGAASLLLTTPSTLQSVANAAPPERTQIASPKEQSFHERYPVAANAASQSADIPTF